jgi:hypothetical protein
MAEIVKANRLWVLPYENKISHFYNPQASKIGTGVSEIKTKVK